MNSFYVKEKIGNTRYLTPDGFLLCKDVPIARAGELEYREFEVPPLKGINGKVMLSRSTETLFNPSTIASFEAKPILDGFHKMVTPDNYRDISVGTITNVRQGEGDRENLLLADLLIMDRATIERIQNGSVGEVSIGFDAEYQQIGDGKGEQTNILGNHIALVADGRAGSICSIGDEKPKEMKDMADKTEQGTGVSVDLSVLEKLTSMLGLGKSNDAPAQSDAEPVAVAPGDMETRLKAIEETVAKLASVEKQEHGQSFDAEAMKALSDQISKLLANRPDGTTTSVKNEGAEAPNGGAGVVIDAEPDEDTEVVGNAEIISPGIEVPKGDAASVASSLRINALTDIIKVNEAAKNLVGSIIGKKHLGDLSHAPKPLINAAFRATAEMIRSDNNSGMVNGLARIAFADSKKDKPVVATGADLQAIYSEAYKKP